MYTCYICLVSAIITWLLTNDVICWFTCLFIYIFVCFLHYFLFVFNFFVSINLFIICIFSPPSCWPTVNVQGQWAWPMVSDRTLPWVLTGPAHPLISHPASPPPPPPALLTPPPPLPPAPLRPVSPSYKPHYSSHTLLSSRRVAGRPRIKRIPLRVASSLCPRAVRHEYLSPSTATRQHPISRRRSLRRYVVICDVSRGCLSAVGEVSSLRKPLKRSLSRQLESNVHSDWGGIRRENFVRLM